MATVEGVGFRFAVGCSHPLPGRRTVSQCPSRGRPAEGFALQRILSCREFFVFFPPEDFPFFPAEDFSFFSPAGDFAIHFPAEDLRFFS